MQSKYSLSVPPFTEDSWCNQGSLSHKPMSQGSLSIPSSTEDPQKIADEVYVVYQYLHLHKIADVKAKIKSMKSVKQFRNQYKQNLISNYK